MIDTTELDASTAKAASWHVAADSIVLVPVEEGNVPFGGQFFWRDEKGYLQSMICEPGCGGEHMVYAEARVVS